MRRYIGLAGIVVVLVLWGVLEWQGLRAAREPSGRHLVTWYGDAFAGQVMANGAVYDPNDLSVIATPYRRHRLVLCIPGACFVHTWNVRKYPLGAQFLLTNEATGRQRLAVVQDACAGCSWWHMDLSRALFAEFFDLDRGIGFLHAQRLG